MFPRARRAPDCYTSGSISSVYALDPDIAYLKKKNEMSRFSASSMFLLCGHVFANPAALKNLKITKHFQVKTRKLLCVLYLSKVRL